MSWGGTGNRGWPIASGGALTPDELNSVYTHGQFWVPAGALTPGVNLPITFEDYQPASGYPTYTVGVYAPTTDTEAFFTWAFKSDLPADPSASLLLKINFLWFVKVAAEENLDSVQWATGASNQLMGTSIDYDNSAGEVIWNRIVAAPDILHGGIAANVEAALAVPITNDVVSGSDWNQLTIMAERHGATGGENDDYPENAYLIGVGVQWAVDFNNVAVWPLS